MRKVRYGLAAGIIILILITFAAYYPKIDRSQSSSTTAFQGTINNSSIWFYSFPIIINYSGSWHLTYWGAAGGTVTLDNVNGNNLDGTGNYQDTITLHGLRGSESELCASATKLNSQNNLNLTFAVSAFTNSTSASNSPVNVCIWVGQLRPGSESRNLDHSRDSQ